MYIFSIHLIQYGWINCLTLVMMFMKIIIKILNLEVNES